MKSLNKIDFFCSLINFYFDGGGRGGGEAVYSSGFFFFLNRNCTLKNCMTNIFKMVDSLEKNVNSENKWNERKWIAHYL